MRLKDNFQFPEDQKNGILILDSGIGSLSLLSSINTHLPNVPLIAFADQEFFPYGEKKEAEIVERLLSVSGQLVKICEPKTILVACNTASTIVLPKLRSRFDIPIVGIVPGIKPAAQQSKNRKAVLLATRGTINRKYIDHLINDYAGDCQIIKLGSSLLAAIAEKKIVTGELNVDQLKAELAKVYDHPDADCLILGCTHFSYIKEDIQKLVGEEMLIIDPVRAVTEQVIRVNNSPGIKNAQNFLISSGDKKIYSNLDTELYGISEIIYL